MKYLSNPPGRVKIFRIPITVLLFWFVSFSCDPPIEVPDDPSIFVARDILAPGPLSTDKTYYSLRENLVVESSHSDTDKWDIAFRGSYIFVNGGVSGPGEGAALLVSKSFEEIVTAPEGQYSQDTADALAIPSGSNNGWYRYTASSFPANAILPLEVVIVLRLANGHFAKLEILSYYLGNPDINSPDFASVLTRTAAGFYTFRYFYQEDGSRNLSK